MKRSAQGQQHWNTLLSTIRVFGYAEEVVDDPPTVFCRGERGTLVLRPGGDGEVLMMVDGGSDFLFPQFPTPEFIIENISNYIGSPKPGGDDVLFNYQQDYLRVLAAIGANDRRAQRTQAANNMLSGILRVFP